MDETAMEILLDGKHGLSLKQGLNRLYKDKTLCDVTLTSSDDVDIQAHWLVLAAHSDFLRHRAVSRNVMQSMVSDTGSLKLNIESEILKMMLDYLYTGELVVTKDTVHKIKLAAKVLQLSKALALLEQSHLSGLGDQSYEAESKILQPTVSLQAPDLEQQQLQSPEDQEFAVMGTLTQSPASYGQIQSMQSPAPFVQGQTTASPMLYSQGYLQSQHYDIDSHKMQQPATVLKEEASPLQPTILSVESIRDSQTAFSSLAFSNAYPDQRPHTKDSSHEHSSVIHGKGGVVCTQQEGHQQNVSMEISPCTEVSTTNNQDDGLYGSTSQRVHSSDDATSHKAEIAFSESSHVPPEHESGEPGRRRSEPTRQFLDEGQIVAGKRPGGPRNSRCLLRPAGKHQAVIQTKIGRPGVFKGFNVNIPKFQCSSAKYVNLSAKKKKTATEKQIKQTKLSSSFVLEAVKTYLSQERSLNEQKKGESSHLSAEVAPEEMTAQNKCPYSSGSCSITRDSVEVDLGLVKTVQFDGLDYVIYENPDTSDTDSCGKSLSHCAQDKARNCRARKIITSKHQKHSYGSMSYYRLTSVLRSKYLLSQYVQNMCIWKTEMSPFRCKVCKRRFKHLSSLKYHCLSTHLSKVRRLKRNLQTEALSATQPSSQASTMECRLRMSRRMSTQQDHTANTSLLQSGEDRQNVASDNSMPSTTADRTSSGSEKKHFKQENSRTREFYISPRYPCSNCGKPFQIESNMLCHFEICKNTPKVKDENIPHGKVIGEPKEIASSCRADVKKSSKFQLTRLYTNGTTCTLCKKTFSRADTTRMHIRTVHFKEKRYTCECKEEFSWTDLTAHKKTCHLITQQKGNIFSS